MHFNVMHFSGNIGEIHFCFSFMTKITDEVMIPSITRNEYTRRLKFHKKEEKYGVIR